MTTDGPVTAAWRKPALEELGADLLAMGKWERAWALLSRRLAPHLAACGLKPIMLWK